jgi:hypothetical protein
LAEFGFGGLGHTRQGAVTYRALLAVIRCMRIAFRSVPFSHEVTNPFDLSFYHPFGAF